MRQRKLLPMCFGITACILAGCTDNNYSIQSIDYLLGFGGEELVLPTISTQKITVNDFLKESGAITVKDNGDYEFTQKGNDIGTVVINVPEVTTDKQEFESLDIPLTQSIVLDGVGEKREVNVGVDAYHFDYSGSLPEEIVSLTSLGVKGNFDLALQIPQNVRDAFSEIDCITLEWPGGLCMSGIEISGGTLTYDETHLKLEHLELDKDIKVKLPLQSLSFNSDAEKDGVFVDLVNRKVGLKGEISAHVYIAPEHMKTNSGKVYASAFNDEPLALKTKGSLTPITITECVGRFSPSIAMDNIGNVEIKEVPDFLTSERVVADLANPQINLQVESDLCVAGLISGTIHAKKDGKEIATVDVPELTIHENAITKICLCRDKSLTTQYEGVEYFEVSNLSDIIKSVPDEISFDVSTAVDDSKDVYYQLGHDYHITPSYEVNAPLAFGKDARIEYNQAIDGWGETLSQLKTTKGSKVELTAEIQNQLPVDLITQAEPIDKNGNSLADKMTISIKTDKDNNEILADSKGTTMTISVEADEPDALQELDGINLSVTGKTNEQMVGVTLNAEKHSLQITSLQAKLKGKIIIDANKK